MPKYIFRLDDICPMMNWQKLERIKNLFFEYGVKPIIAVIPDNQDEKLKATPCRLPDATTLQRPGVGRKEQFWQKIKELENRGWTIAMHGYQHKYTQENGGILKIHTKSEFAGLSHQEQFGKIKKGKEILENHGIKTGIFIAPGHSFDKNTLDALEKNGFNTISDGIALYPFKKYAILWIPQIAWQPRKFKCGIITFCLHLNTMQENDFKNLEDFIKNNQTNIMNFEYAINWHKRKNLFNKIMLAPINFIFRRFWYLHKEIR